MTNYGTLEITQIKTCHLFHGTPSKLTENNLEPKGHKYDCQKREMFPPQKIKKGNTKIIYSNMFNTILWSGCWQAGLSGIHCVDGGSNNTSEDYIYTGLLFPLLVAREVEKEEDKV